MLREAAPADATDHLFIVGDTHQRIYDHRVTLGSLGINVRGGRSHRLRITYRTTEEILHWAVGLLTGEHFDDLDGGDDTLRGYRSQLHGGTPVTQGYASLQEELDALVTAVEAWLDGGRSGIDPKDIGVAARTGDTARRACDALNAYDLQRERCLIYVACTRARDELRVTWNGQPSEFLRPLLAAEQPTRTQWLSHQVGQRAGILLRATASDTVAVRRGLANRGAALPQPAV